MMDEYAETYVITKALYLKDFDKVVVVSIPFLVSRNPVSSIRVDVDNGLATLGRYANEIHVVDRSGQLVFHYRVLIPLRKSLRMIMPDHGEPYADDLICPTGVSLYAPNGGATVVVDVNPQTRGVVFAAAICSMSDKFVPKVGVEVARSRLRASENQVPIKISGDFIGLDHGDERWQDFYEVHVTSVLDTASKNPGSHYMKWRQ